MSCSSCVSNNVTIQNRVDYQYYDNNEPTNINYIEDRDRGCISAFPTTNKYVFIIPDKLPPPVCGTCPLKIHNVQQYPYGNSNKYTSVYMENKSSLQVYNYSKLLYQDVNWNQSSDRPIPHIQSTSIFRNSSSLRGTKTSLKPGATSPGGKGVDVKHNSFNRYNLRLRGSLLKRKSCCS
jgi:hypothetical protein